MSPSPERLARTLRWYDNEIASLMNQRDDLTAQVTSLEAERDREKRRKDFHRREHYAAQARVVSLTEALRDAQEHHERCHMLCLAMPGTVRGYATGGNTIAADEGEGTPDLPMATVIMNAIHEGRKAARHTDTTPPTCPTCGSDGPWLAYHSRLGRWIGEGEYVNDTVKPCRDPWHGLDNFPHTDPTGTWHQAGVPQQAHLDVEK